MATSALTEIIPGWDLASDAQHERLDAELLARAYRFSERLHSGQVRRNGDPVIRAERCAVCHHQVPLAE